MMRLIYVDSVVQIQGGKMRYKENETGTFGKASEMWLEAVRPKLKESSMVKYRNIIRVHLLPYFNGRSMAELDRLSAYLVQHPTLKV